MCLGCAKKCALAWASAPKCASCNKAFTPETIDAMFKKGFRRGPLRIAAIQNLQEQEMSLLPQTMLVLAAQQQQELWAKLYEELREEFSKTLLSPVLKPLDVPKVIQLQDALKATGLAGPVTKKARVETVRTAKCPKPECLGYIAMSGPGSGSCALCKTRVCKSCNSTFTDGHECNPEDVASWTLIKESSKACPKCGTHIEKVSGCNQMWCTVAGCNTAFDWASERIINGPIHNPHYHEWLRGGGAVVPDANLLCEVPRDIISTARIRDTYNLFLGFSTSASHIYNRMCQWLRALPEGIDGHYNLNENRFGDYTPESYEDLRLLYLRGRITKKRWASQLSHRETTRMKHFRLLAIQRMFQSASADVFLKMHTAASAMARTSGTPVARPYDGVTFNSVPAEGLPILEEFLKSMESLRKYSITETVKILSDYSDSAARVLEWMPVDSTKKAYNLTWGRVPMATLVQKYGQGPAIGPFD